MHFWLFWNLSLTFSEFVVKLYTWRGENMYNRIIKDRILKVSKMFRVMVVTGPRQVGKSTLLKSLMPEGMTYVTLDWWRIKERS